MWNRWDGRIHVETEAEAGNLSTCGLGGYRAIAVGQGEGRAFISGSLTKMIGTEYILGFC